jgi:hypothetical protein
MTRIPENPFIKNFCHQLVARKMDVEKMGPEKLDQMVESLYVRFESLLGRNIVESLPEEEREAFKGRLAGISLDKEAQNLDRMAEMFGNMEAGGMDMQSLLEYTLQELSDEFTGDSLSRPPSPDS